MSYKIGCICTVSLLTLLVVSAARAQTNYTQTKPQACRIGEYICNGIPLDGGSYNFVASHYIYLSVGDEFVLNENGLQHYGKIIEVIEQPPAIQSGNSGGFSFIWQTDDGLSGQVSGEVKIIADGRWLLPMVESSTVTVN